MSKTIQQRLNQFRKNIRKQQIQQYKSNKRQELVEHQQSNSLSIKQQYIQTTEMMNQKKPYKQVIQRNLTVLLSPFNIGKQQKINQQQFTLEMHINFWRQFHYDIYQHIRYTSSMLKQFLLKFIKLNPSSILQKSQPYSLQFHYLLMEASVYFSRDQKDQILGWISSISSLQVIDAYVSSAQFLSNKSYPNLYIILKSAIKSNNKQQRNTGLKTLIKMIKYAQRDQIYEMFSQHLDIVMYVIKYINQKCKKQQITDYWLFFIYCLNTFDDIIVQYASTGIISTCGLMISSMNDMNIFGGLEILRIFSEVKDRTIMSLLLVDEEMQNSKMWLMLAIQLELHKHYNKMIRKSFMQIVKNIIVYSNYFDIKALCDKFVFKGRNIFDCFSQVLQQCHQQDVQLDVLRCIAKLLFSISRQSKISECLILMTLQNRNILPFISNLIESELQSVREYARDIIYKVEEIQSNTNMEEL